jgi:hypothetical protein
MGASPSACSSRENFHTPLATGLAPYPGSLEARSECTFPVHSLLYNISIFYCQKLYYITFAAVNTPYISNASSKSDQLKGKNFTTP